MSAAEERIPVHRLRLPLALMVTAMGLTALVDWPGLMMPFLYDDISVIAIASPERGANWLTGLAPMSNGFWRPALLTITHALTTVFGLEPLAFNLTALVIHGAAAASAGVFAMRALSRGAAVAWLVTALFATSTVALSSATELPNICDSLLGLGVLWGLVLWDRWLVFQRRRDLAMVFGAFLLCLAAKETGVMLPPVLLIWSIHRGFSRRRTLMPLAVLFALAGIFGALALAMMGAGEHSYSGQGRLSAGAFDFLPQLGDHLAALVLPTFTIMPLLWSTSEIDPGARWLVQVLMLTVAVAVALRFTRAPRHRPLSALLVIAVVLALPAGLANQGPHIRYLYAPAVFVCIALAGALAAARGWRRLAVGEAIGIWWLYALASHHLSPHTQHMRRSAHEVASLIPQIEALASDWEPGSKVLIDRHPHPGGFNMRWVYCQLIFDIWIPETGVTVAINPAEPGIRHAYRWEDGALRELPEAIDPALRE